MTPIPIERILGKVILYSRYILVVFYVGLAVSLAIYAAYFILKLGKLAIGFITASENQVLLAMLSLIDSALVAGLVVMVMLSSYDNFVSRLDDGETRQMGWLMQLDPGNLKIKVASAIVAISSVHLLQIFLDTAHYSNEHIFWKVTIHVVFIASAVFMGLLDRIMAQSKAK